MVYIVVVYDVAADRTRLFRKLLRRYLVHVQHSVFEGELTPGTRTDLESELETLLEEGESVIIYEVTSEKWMDRTIFGDDPAEDSQFL